MNWIISVITFLMGLFLMYRNTIDFFVCILYPSILLNLLLSSSETDETYLTVSFSPANYKEIYLSQCLLVPPPCLPFLSLVPQETGTVYSLAI